MHTVADTGYLVGSGAFQRYVQGHPQIAPFAKQENLSDWQRAQRPLDRLRLHRKQARGLRSHRTKEIAMAPFIVWRIQVHCSRWHGRERWSRPRR